jgi:polyphenol oxidase
VSARLEILDAGLTGVVAGFTTRAGGVSSPPWDGLNLALHVGDDAERVVDNRDVLTLQLGAPSLNLPQQVHGPRVAVLGAGDVTADTGVPDVDALVTAERGVLLGVLVADCMPVLLVDSVHGVVGAVHAGRRGLAEGVLQTTLAQMAALGAEPGSTSAVIGPAICGGCYEVPEAMRSAVDALVPGTATETTGGTAGLDLPAGALGVLRAAGVTDVAAIGICTAEDARFFSYRRDGVTGRFAGFVMLALR